MTDLTPGRLLPVLGPGELWAIGLVVVLAVLRPVGRLGWAVAGAAIAGGVASLAGVALGVGPSIDGAGDAGLWLLVPWAVLAVLLAATAAGQPLRWEPRSGPSVATALLWGSLVVHVSAAWHADGGALATAAERWLSDGGGGASLGPDVTGPLAVPLAWVTTQLMGGDGATGVGLLTLVAAAGAVVASGVLAGSWGYTGTARATAAAVAWAPPLLLAHALAPSALVATTLLVWSWWALVEIWAGRHLPDRMALLSGALLGAAVGTGPWVVVVAPLWLRRLGGRKLGWFVVGLVGALVASVAALIPTGGGLGDLWRAGLELPARGRGVPVTWALVPAAAAVLAVLRRVPLSPTRLSAVTGALLVVTLPWWPSGWEVTGPLVAVPFVLLAAVAPDRPEERWPPDAPVHADRPAARAGS